MSTVHSSVETINAAATAIVTAESRVQPTISQKRTWGSRLSLYWCFGSYKHSKRITHAGIVPKSTVSQAAVPVSENGNSTAATIVLPFIAPPSSPASFLQSDPPSATLTPAKRHSSPEWHASIFTIGPYAHETQLVSPPVFSAFTTEPSTACFTPPPESVQFTTPPSPEVPFAQLLTSSLARSQKNGGTNLKLPLSQYDYQPYTDSPVRQLISPGSAISYSGTQSPFPDNYPGIEFHKGDAPTFLGYEHFFVPKWGSRLDSGSLTPIDGVPASRDCFIWENQISEVASFAGSEIESRPNEMIVDHRVSFELTGEEDVPTGLEKQIVTESPQAVVAEGAGEFNTTTTEASSIEMPCEEASREGYGELCHKRIRSITLGSTKEFNFDSRKEESPENPTMGSEETMRKELVPTNNWSFFQMVQPRVS